jgi:peptidoglycan/LPS O-acetylase OafA/YrhL
VLQVHNKYYVKERLLVSLFKNPIQHTNIPVLDGVRAIACFGVISYHIHYFISHVFDLNAIFGLFAAAVAMAGWSGVTLFFVLSGFLLFMPYAKALLFAQRWPSARSFYLRRALRILPGYYIALSLLILLAHPQYLQPDHLGDLGLFVTLLMDSTRQTYQQINGPFWTLAIEWQYYMLLPLFALGIGLLVRRGKTSVQRCWFLVACLLGLVIWGLVTRFVGIYYTAHPSETILVPRRVLNVFLLLTYGVSGKYYEDFAVGMLLSTLYIASHNATPTSKISQFFSRYDSWFWGAGILLLFFMAVWSVFPALSFLGPLIGAHALLTELGYATGFAACIAALLFGAEERKRLFDWAPLRWLGGISYSLYIWHLPILLFFMSVLLDKLPGLHFFATYVLYWLCVAVLIVPFSYLFYCFVEAPWIQLAHKNRQKERMAGAS